MKRFITSLIFALLLKGLMFAQIDPKDVEIVRDQWGVPHIYGKTDADAAYGLAWAHAEDNFEDIQLHLLAVKNRLGRVEGIDGAIFDYGMFFLGIDSIVEKRYETDLSPEYRAVVEAYIQGINDYAEAHPKEAIKRKRAFPYTAKDLVKSYTLNTSLLAGVGLALKAIRENEIDRYFEVNDVGSNAIAVAPEKMEDTTSYLLVNSHQPIEGRFAWYEAHINSEEGWNFIGGLFPGGTSGYVGSNPNLGWAHTTNYHTFGDIFLLEINPNNRNQYKYDDEWLDFEKDRVRLFVRLAGMPIPVKRKIYFSKFGPVFKTKHGMYALRFPAPKDIRATEQWWRMNKAQNFEEFEEAMRMQAMPLFNTIYADKEGNIMMYSGGKVPKRNPKLDWTLPITSSSSDYRWNEILPYDALPLVVDPECGYVFNCNNTPTIATGDTCNWEEDFLGLQKFHFNRGEIFDELLAEHEGPFSEEDLLEIKYNSSYKKEGSYMDHFNVMYNLDESKYPEIADAIKKLKAWNLSGEIDNEDAALAMIVHDLLRKKLKTPFGFLMIKDGILKEEDIVWAISKAKRFLNKTHGSIDVPLGEVQRIIRGNKNFPADGLREVPHATDTKLYSKRKGIYKVVGGDGYIQITRFPESGAEVKSIHIHGASEHKDSEHYSDQTQMFIDHEYKEMTFDKEVIYQNAKKIYHPESH